MHRLSTMMMPKCRGEIPRLCAMGKKIGVKIRTAGVISIKIPTSSKIKLISSKIKIGLSVSDSNELLNDCGIVS